MDWLWTKLLLLIPPALIIIGAYYQYLEASVFVQVSGWFEICSTDEFGIWRVFWYGIYAKSISLVTCLLWIFCLKCQGHLKSTIATELYEILSSILRLNTYVILHAKGHHCLLWHETKTFESLTFHNKLIHLSHNWTVFQHNLCFSGFLTLFLCYLGGRNISFWVMTYLQWVIIVCC